MIFIKKFKIQSIFYIGKGTKTRAHDHIKEATKFDFSKKKLKEKAKKIKEIYETPIETGSDQKFGILIYEIRHNSTNQEALDQEYAMIDAIGINNLTNQKREKFSLGWPEKVINSRYKLNLIKYQTI